MSIRSKLSVVNLAEADSALRRAAVGAAWRGLKQEAERAATPRRVLVAGLVGGFVSGLRGSRGDGGSPLGGKVFGMLLESAFSSFSAAMAAGAAAATGAQSEPAASENAKASGEEHRQP